MQIEGPVVVSRKGQARVERGHPWVFRSDVVKDGGATPGRLVRVAGVRGEPLGFALWSARSEIRLRMLERGETLAASFLRDRIERALRWRETVAAGAEAYRVVHGEGDGLPSLVVDRYGDYLVDPDAVAGDRAGQARDRGGARGAAEAAGHRRAQRPAGADARGPRADGLRAPRRGAGRASRSSEGDVRLGGGPARRGRRPASSSTSARTTWRRAATRAGRVLDGFCYDGGFALQVAREADEVIAVDLSAEALARVKANAARNGLANVRRATPTSSTCCTSSTSAGERFDTVILDPPAFAKSKDAIPKAARGYKEINLRALRILKPGGCLITCSCSYHIHEDDFEAILADAATDAGATVTVVEKRRQARDHPVVLGVPETYYLKCFVLRRLE